MRKYFVTILILSLSHWAFAQDASQEDIKNIRQGQIYFLGSQGVNNYNNGFNVGGRLNTNGWDVYLELEKRKDSKIQHLFQFELGETKSPKGNKRSKKNYGRNPVSGNIRLESGRRYVYGKKNVFYQARLGYGRRRTIGNKGNNNGVEVSAIYMGGITMGLLKPYYLELIDEDNETTYYTKFTPENANDFLDDRKIVESGGFGRGWKELKINPGIYARLGMRFDWAEYNEFVSAIEVGLTGSYYSKKAQIMVKEKGDTFFYGAYISLLFGKRW